MKRSPCRRRHNCFPGGVGGPTDAAGPPSSKVSSSTEIRSTPPSRSRYTGWDVECLDTHSIISPFSAVMTMMHSSPGWMPPHKGLVRLPPVGLDLCMILGCSGSSSPSTISCFITLNDNSKRSETLYGNTLCISHHIMEVTVSCLPDLVGRMWRQHAVNIQPAYTHGTIVSLYRAQPLLSFSARARIRMMEDSGL